MTTSISLLNYDVLVCIIIKELDEMRLDGLCSSNPLRIPHPKIDKLACQAQGVGIFAEGEISLLDAYCTFKNIGRNLPTLVLYHTFFEIAIVKSKIFKIIS